MSAHTAIIGKTRNGKTHHARLFKDRAAARRAGVEILAARPSIWPGVRSRVIWALRGAVRGILRGVGCLITCVLAAAVVLGILAIVSACLALVPFLLALIVGGFLIWRRFRA